MKNFIVIPVHNQLDHLKKCISSIERKTRNYEIVIVDDASTDINTKNWIATYPNAYKIFNSESYGFSRACNEGIKFIQSKFDYNFICLLNSDTEIITDNWLSIIEDEMLKINNPGVGSVVSDNAGAQSIKNIQEYQNTIDQRPTYSLPLPHGFCYVITKNAIDKIGLLDEIVFPHYGSEDDYSLISIKNELTNFLVSKVLVLHHASVSYTKERRSDLLTKSVPALMDKWTRLYVIECCNKMNIITNKLNQPI